MSHDTGNDMGHETGGLATGTHVLERVTMTEAAAILQVSDRRVARRVLDRWGVESSRCDERDGLLTAARSDVERVAVARGGRVGPGRPWPKAAGA